MLDDDVARDLALFAGLVWEDRDRDALAPLTDAMIVWADEEQLDAIAAPIVESLWLDELREDIERALDDLAGRGSALGEAIPAARADLALGPGRSRLALAYVKQGALDLTDGAMLPGRCLCCVDDMLGVAPPETHEQLVLDAAVAIALRTAPAFGVDDPSDDDLTAAGERIRGIAALATPSLPRLAAALQAAEIDAVWRAARIRRRAEIAARN